MKLLTLLMLMLSVLVSCASEPFVLDNRYVFPQFEKVDRLTTFNMNSWQVIDSQSLIVKTSPSTHYLLILQRRIHDLHFAEQIGITSTGSTINTRFDCVKVKIPSCGPDPFQIPIHSMYKLEGKEDVAEAKRQITEE